MGMYDEIICDYPLPGAPPAFVKPGHPFQTKDLECTLATYTIGDDGKFSDPEYTGTIEFYSSNIVGGGPGNYTADGEDAESVTYEAEIVGGVLVWIKETARSIEPAFPIRKMHEDNPSPTDAEIEEIERLRKESVVGRRFYVLAWWREGNGYWVDVVNEDDRQLCLRRLDGKLQLLPRYDRPRMCFESEEQAEAQRAREAAKRQAERDEWEAYAKAWKEKREAAGAK